MQLITQFARRDLAGTSARMRKVVETMPDAALTWQPPAPEINSVAQIVRHVAVGQRHLLAMAAGDGPVITSMDPYQRGLNNDPATRAELLGLLTETDAVRERILARLDTMDLSETVAGPGVPESPRFFLVAYSIGEAREHLGHAELTAQLWQSQRPSPP